MTVYFDNAATTRVRGEAANVMLQIMLEEYGNPSSTHRMGRDAKAALDAARVNVATALGASPSEVYFTSGGTESDNWAIMGAAYAMRHRGHHIITTAAEHDAVGKPVEKLVSDGWEATFIEPDKYGRVSANAVKAALREDTAIVSVMLVNNETGAVNPVAEIAEAVRASGCGALIHTDAVQAFCKVPFSVKTMGVDLAVTAADRHDGVRLRLLRAAYRLTRFPAALRRYGAGVYYMSVADAAGSG